MAVHQHVKKFHVTHKNWRFIAMFTKPRQRFPHAYRTPPRPNSLNQIVIL